MGNYNFTKEQKEATEYTVDINQKFAKEYGLNQKRCINDEYYLSTEKCIYPVKDIYIETEYGEKVWDLEKFSFLDQSEVPDTVNPSLWINGKSNHLAGVFEVIKDKIYQVRGIDIANLSIIRSDNGWIVQDVMTSIETSAKAIQLLEDALEENIKDNIKAIIISHSHGDHFGGLRGVVKPEQVGKVSEGKIPIYVPAGFEEECVKENVFAGPAMGRRAAYQFGGGLEPSPKGIVSTGLGLSSPRGTISFITPTDHIDHNQTINIDGIDVEFQITPGTEAPSEMNNYFSNYRALWMAENCTGTLHNTYPIRGAQLRDASAWTDYILEAIDKFADRSDVVFQSHNWPHFNTKENPDAVKEYLLNNAAIYKNIHDQTLHYANQGYTAKEVARKIIVPKKLGKNWYTRPYYGSVEINSRAVYTKYLGFYNGNPNDVNPLTEAETAKLFVEYSGGADKVIAKSLEDYEAGNYKASAYAASQVVYAEPENEKARLLCADAFEQLGYIAESSIWRNAYLQGALELREGVSKAPKKSNAPSDLAVCMSEELLLKYLGILLKTNEVQDEEFSFQLNIVDPHLNNNDKKSYKGKELGVKKRFVVSLYGGVLLAYKVDTDKQDAYATLTKKDLFMLTAGILKEQDVETNVFSYLDKIQKHLDNFSKYSDFNLIEPVK